MQEDPARVEARLLALLARLEKRHAEHADEFDSAEHARSTGRAHVVCLGDSHVREINAGLKPEAAAPPMPHAWVDTCSVIGATARGLGNPRAKTNALHIFQRRIELASTWQQLVFQLGEVDCGYTIWHRAKKRGDPVDELVLGSIENYVAFLDGLRSRGFDELFVLSAPATGDAIASYRPDETASQRERTDLTMRFNHELERRAGAYTFVDITTPTLDPDTGLVTAAFLKDPVDHHLAPEPYARLIGDRLGPHLVPPL